MIAKFSLHLKQTEIILLPVEDGAGDTQQRLQDILLSAPTLPDDELRPFEEVREWMNQWNVHEF